jgi:hypothetical protein
MDDFRDIIWIKRSWKVADRLTVGKLHLDRVLGQDTQQSIAYSMESINW